MPFAPRLALIGLALFLTACDLPRGAGLRDEVLARSASDPAVTGAEFGLEQVTRAALPRLAAWPATDAAGLRWINGRQQPATRSVAAGDKVTVTIWSTEENGLLTASGQRQVALGPMTVSSEGSVFIPYVGRVRIAGMSPEHAREALETAVTAVTPAAQVQLALEEGRQNTVSLVGGVARPGSYPLPDNDYSLLQLVADGGGALGNLDNPQVRLMRGNEVFGTALERLYADPGLDTRLAGGDRVILEEDRRYFLSLGAAGSEAMHPFTRDRISALEAMAIIGGVNDSRGNPQGILVLRQYPPTALRPDGTGPSHERMVFALDLTSADGLFSAGDFAIRSGDLVYVSESPLTTANSIFGLIGSLLGLASRANDL
ncbi:MAG: polysaccharide biosynthesis/export family protein [Rubellimicrobium sp.]|nr:polysaccharide biosynthesis/export family protein [Rubellimicrobium sp.]